jgi:hypothetical protein
VFAYNQPVGTGMGKLKSVGVRKTKSSRHGVVVMLLPSSESFKVNEIEYATAKRNKRVLLPF